MVSSGPAVAGTRHAADNVAVSVAPCGVAVGDYASNNTITCSSRTHARAVRAGHRSGGEGCVLAPRIHRIADISKTLWVTEDAGQNVVEDRRR